MLYMYAMYTIYIYICVCVCVWLCVCVLNDKYIKKREIEREKRENL